MCALSACTVVTLSPSDAQAGNAKARSTLGSSKLKALPLENPKGVDRFILCPLMALNSREGQATRAGSYHVVPLNTLSFYKVNREVRRWYKRTRRRIVAYGHILRERLFLPFGLPCRTVASSPEFD
jgi:hypothetical protein